MRFQLETHQNIIQKQNPPQFTSQYYPSDAGTLEMPSADFSDRHAREDRDGPWWLIEKPFTETQPAPVQKPQSSNNNGNTDHQQGISRPGGLQHHWWYSESPFTPSSALPPPLSPPQTKPIPKPITEPVQSQIRGGEARISEISELNPNIQNSCAMFVFVLTVVWMRLGIHSSGI
jgi:hypothetical protein